MDIMIVDDDQDDIEVFCEVVAEINKDLVCVTARDGIDALKKLETYPRLPKCIFLDVNMPLMNGSQTLEAIRKNPRYTDIFIVMFSTTHNFTEINGFISAGIDFVVKPDSYQKMAEIIKRYLAKTGIQQP